jgi:hypothetical protein
MTAMRLMILRANALYIGVAGAAGLLFDVRGILFGVGHKVAFSPQRRMPVSVLLKRMGWL